MRAELLLCAAVFAAIFGASGQINLDDSLKTAGVGAAVGAVGTAIVGAPVIAGAIIGAAGGAAYARFEEPLLISLR